MTREPSQMEILKFAKHLLFYLGFIFVSVAFAKILMNNENANAVWDFVTNFIPSLITLIIGFYFGKRS